MLFAASVIHAYPTVLCPPVRAPAAPRRFLHEPKESLTQRGSLRSNLSLGSARNRKAAPWSLRTAHRWPTVCFCAPAVSWLSAPIAAPAQPKSTRLHVSPCRRPANPHPVVRIRGPTAPPVSLLPYRQYTGTSLRSSSNLSRVPLADSRWLPSEFDIPAGTS